MHIRLYHVKVNRKFSIIISRKRCADSDIYTDLRLIVKYHRCVLKRLAFLVYKLQFHNDENPLYFYTLMTL